MSDTPQRPRRRGRPRKALPVEGGHHHEGDRRRYIELAGQMEILGFTEPDNLFLQREEWLIQQIWELAQKRNLIELVDETPSDGN